MTNNYNLRLIFVEDIPLKKEYQNIKISLLGDFASLRMMLAKAQFFQYGSF
jgi:hypothetical protein